ncbi:MAG: radical SAM/SPASM domain-containing protein [Nitrospirae bacterium RBG_13_39_12]|nr:MAG: radical SAM/SPASM domain-containing protein [Nitrospirae bacterium RBG_13_39_12]
MVTKCSHRHCVVMKRYPDQNYCVYFNRETGFFARVEDNGHKEPFWARHGPELLDISITNWCDKNCLICYRNSGPNGSHITLNEYENLLVQAKEMDVLQIALGGGNPNQHPEFPKMLQLTREKYGIVPSYTTNGRGLNKDVLNATKDFCGAVAVSAYSPYTEMEEAIKLLAEYKIKTNLHYILHSESLERAIKWLNNGQFPGNINAIIFLNYKPIGRLTDSNLLLRNSTQLISFFEFISRRDLPFKVGFDSCSISGIVKYMNINPVYYEACEASRFSAFVSEQLKMYPCSFMINMVEGVDLIKTSMSEAWQTGEPFVEMRIKLANNNCQGCKSVENCLGGCPLFSDINLCNAEAEHY